MNNIKTNLTVPLVEEGIFTEEPMPTHYTTGGDTSGLDAVRSKIREIAQGKSVTPLRVIHFEDPKDFLRVLTPKRFELFQYVRSHGGAESIEELATAIARDRGTVSRDLKELARMGFVRLLETVSPGHGKRVSVRPPEGELELRFRA
jgi:predicted transcriptional regulator